MKSRLIKSLAFALCLSSFAMFAIGSGSDTTTGSASSASKKTEDTDEKSQVVTDEKKEEEVDTISTTTDYGNMSVRDIAKHDSLYVGLSAVKQMDSLPVALGDNEEVESGHKVIAVFFDLFNSSESLESFSENDVSCYADGIQVNGVETYIKAVIDGYTEIHSYYLDGGTQAIACIDYEVPENWQEIKVFYKSNYIWTITPNDLISDRFDGVSMYDVDNSREPANDGDVIYNDKYELIYQGYETYTYNNVIYGDVPYAVFKFRINNTSSEVLDYSLVGYKMRAYVNNYLVLDDATYTMDDKIGEFINIYDIDEIQVGMSANVYVAFDISNCDDGPIYMIYDAGYISNDILGTVYVNE